MLDLSPLAVWFALFQLIFYLPVILTEKEIIVQNVITQSRGVKNIVSNIPYVLTKRKERSQPFQSKMDFVFTGIEFTSENIRKMLDYVKKIEGDRAQLREFFKHMGRQLEEDLNSIQHSSKEIDWNHPGLTDGYYVTHEEEIRKSVASLYQYLNDTKNELHRNNFFQQAAVLPASLNSLINGLLGRGKSRTHGDIMVALSEVLRCDGRMLRKGLKVLTGKIALGYLIHDTYSRAESVNTTCFQTALTNSFDRILFRLVNEILPKCQADEGNVSDEMRRIIETHNVTNDNRKVIADAILHFLQDHYDTKKWIVVVLPDGTLKWMQSLGFHTVTAKGLSALAVSTADPKDAPEFFRKVEDRYLGFSYVFHDKTSLPVIIQLYRHLNRYLTPLQTSKNGAVETLAIQTCTPSKGKIMDAVIVASDGAKPIFMRNNDMECSSNILLMIAVKVIRPITSPILLQVPKGSSSLRLKHLKCLNNEHFDGERSDGLLRNEFGRGYLSIKEEEAYVILDRQWRNETKQKWSFVNNTLRNEQDNKCLTVQNPDSLYIQQFDCRSDWPGQLWRRNGLQIINGFNKCLAFVGTNEDQMMRVVQKDCDSTLPFLWYDWDLDCEDAIVFHNRTDGGQPLRNEFSGRFLSVGQDDVLIKQEPLQNKPGQLWRFVDGELKNGNDQCLSGNGTLVWEKNCGENSSNQMWTYNNVSQIANVDGNCLSSKDDQVVVNQCQDNSEHRWSFFQTSLKVNEECQTDWRYIEDEMRRLISTKWGSNQTVIADALLDFLENQYNTKWIVIVISNESRRKMEHAQSGGVHAVVENGTFAAAISVTGDGFHSPATSLFVREFLNNFKFTWYTTGESDLEPKGVLKPVRGAYQIHDYLSRCLTPVRSNLQVESLVIQTSCESSEEKMKSSVTIVTSVGVDKSSTQLTTNSNHQNYCINQIAMIVLNTAALTKQDDLSVFDGPLKPVDVLLKCESSGMLRNEFGYLSVLDDSNDEGASIIIDRQWRNSNGQRWRFVNNTLRNDNGKCLTRWSQLFSTYLYQYDCHPDWEGQKLKRTGLQIVWDDGECLNSKGTKEMRWTYVVRSRGCELTSPFLWFDWDVDCEDAAVRQGNGTRRTLRNVFSKLFLSVLDRDEKYAVQWSWSNLVGQHWRFVNGQLRNGDGKCLVGKGWYVQTEDCSTTYNAKKWTYNDKTRQIVSSQGYCLGVDGDGEGYILNNYCEDDSKVRWEFT